MTTAPRSSQNAARIGFAAVVVLLVAGIAGLLFHLQRQPAATSWTVATRGGTPLLDGHRIQGTRGWPLGMAITTDRRSTARVALPAVGTIDLEENTTVKRGSPGEWVPGGVRSSRRGADALSMQAGRASLTLSPSSPESGPLYVVTPSSTVEATRGEMSLVVDSTGTALLRVRAGAAIMSANTVESRLLAGSACLSRQGAGVGTPYYEDASDAFRDALVAIDAAPQSGLVRRIAVDVLLNDARPRDALTLWHLLGRFEPPLRGFVYDRLVQLAPVPRGVTRDAVIAGNGTMLDAWGRALGILAPEGAGASK